MHLPSCTAVAADATPASFCILTVSIHSEAASVSPTNISSHFPVKQLQAWRLYHPQTCCFCHTSADPGALYACWPSCKNKIPKRQFVSKSLFLLPVKEKSFSTTPHRCHSSSFIFHPEFFPAPASTTLHKHYNTTQTYFLSCVPYDSVEIFWGWFGLCYRKWQRKWQ